MRPLRNDAGARLEQRREPEGLGGRVRLGREATGVEEKNIKALIATMDKDKNGSIDRDEFTAGFAHFLSGGVAGPINRRRSKP